MFAYIYEDAARVTRFDRYFDYLASVSNEMPLQLYEFASDHERYELSGDRTLHNARLNSVSVVNECEVGSNLLTKRDVILNLSLAQNKIIELLYGDVMQFEFSHVPAFWPNRAVDLLTHEVRIESGGIYLHNIPYTPL